MDDEEQRVQLNVWIDSDKRDNYDDWADELGYESRGALVRNAVRYFYTSQTEGQREIINELEDIAIELEGMDTKLDGIKTDQLEENDIDSIAVSVQNQVIEEIQSEMLETMTQVFAEADDISEIDETMIRGGFYG